MDDDSSLKEPTIAEEDAHTAASSPWTVPWVEYRLRASFNTTKPDTRADTSLDEPMASYRHVSDRDLSFMPPNEGTMECCEEIDNPRHLYILTGRHSSFSTSRFVTAAIRQTS